MNISKGVNYCLEYHKSNSKETTVRSCEFVLSRFERRFGDRELDSIRSDEVLSFLRECAEGTKQSTKRSRYASLSAFFNLVKNTINPDVQNPCSTPMLRKLFRPAKITHWTILEKEVVDEIIFRTVKPRNRLLLELMARGGMRVSEVLKLTRRDVDGRKLIIRDPKSGKELEVVFIPQKVADRLREYVEQKDIAPDQRIFQLTYQGARAVVKKAGKLVGIHLRPHDLRRHAATHASRSGTPIEIVSKVILRHANLATTQRYLGKVSDTEAMRWIENSYA
jgi:integrase/recombinase XerD